MARRIKNNNLESDIGTSKKESFFERIKNDKKYSAKVQLAGYGVFLVLLVVILNMSDIGSNSGANIVSDNVSDDSNVSENTSIEGANLLKQLDDNYSYDLVVNVIRNSVNAETGELVNVIDKIHYAGKSYGDTLEINKTVNDNTSLYYKVDDNYYSCINNITTLTKEIQIYDMVDAKYIELDGILKLVEKASLDHVTNYSSGKKVLVYHLNVSDLIVGVQNDDVVEINMVEENGVLTIDIDYSSLFKLIDSSIVECKFSESITNIGKIEEFDVIVSAINEKRGDSDNGADSTSEE